MCAALTLAWQSVSAFSLLSHHSDPAYSNEPSAARKIDLTKVLKTQVNPSHAGGAGAKPLSRSGFVVKSDADLTFAPRTTASSGILAAKPSSNVNKKNQTSTIALGSAHEFNAGISEEDDSLEKEMVMSSPMKGGDFRAAKV